MSASLVIGVDPGVRTGLATWSRDQRKLLAVETLGITQAMDIIRATRDSGALHSVRFEDARLRKWFGSSGREQLQGAGSIKRDCAIWEEFLRGLVGVPFLPVSPKAKGAKLDAAAFARLTGWTGRTSEHGRDAAALVWGVTC